VIEQDVPKEKKEIKVKSSKKKKDYNIQQAELIKELDTLLIKQDTIK